MHPITEAKQKALEARKALNGLLDEEVKAKAGVASILGKLAGAGLSDDARKALEGDRDKAQATANEIAARVSAQRGLAQNLDEQALALEESARAEDEKLVTAARAGRARIESAHDNREDQPWLTEAESRGLDKKAASNLRLGRFGIAVRKASTGQGADPRLMAAAGMNVTEGGEGGFAVPVEDSVEIEREMFENGEILSRVDARNIGGNSIKYTMVNQTSRASGSRNGSVLGYWVDEGTAPDASELRLEKVAFELKKVATLGYTTEELEADAPALGEELRNALMEELIFQVEDKVVEGSGAGCPLGFQSAPCTVSVSKETNQAATTIVSANLSKMWARLHPRSRTNAVWLINVDCEPQLDILATIVGGTALEARFVTYGPDGIMRIKGRPVIAVEYAATLGTVGDINLVDLSRYRLTRKAAGVNIASSIHVRFTQGENTYRGIYRCDGQPMPRAAMTPFKGSNTLSPFVTLATRS